MSVKGHTYEKQLFTSGMFRHFINIFTNKETGVTKGCEITQTSTIIKIGAGAFCIQGGFLEEDGGTELTIPTSAGYHILVYEIDLSKTNTKTEFNQGSYKFVSGVGNYSGLMQEDLENGGNIYQFEFCRFRITEAGLEDFQDTRRFIDYGIFVRKNELSNLVVTSSTRLAIPAKTSKKVEFDTVNINRNSEKIKFDSTDNSIVIGEGVQRINVKARAYANLLKLGSYCELKIQKNNTDSSNLCGNGIAYGSQGNEISMIFAEGENIEVEEGDKIFLMVYNSNETTSIALDTFVKTSLSVEVII